MKIFTKARTAMVAGFAALAIVSAACGGDDADGQRW